MSPLTKVSSYPIGGYQLQYTNDAHGQAEALAYGVRIRLHQHMQMVAAVNPYLHGTVTQLYGVNDRRSLHFENLIITFWLSQEVQVLTIVDIRSGGDRDKTPPFGMPMIPQVRIPYHPFIGFDDEDEDEYGTPHPRRRFATAG